MLQITIPGQEFYDEATDQFINTKDTVLTLEHSLVSLSKWESKWCKAFLGADSRSNEETIDYIRCMTVTPNVDPNVYYCLTQDNLKEVSDYIQNPHTASNIYDVDISNNKEGKAKAKDTITSELIYYWMINLQIPFECQKWHLNRLLTLIKICNVKNNPKKMKKADILRRNASLNEARRKAWHSKG